MKPSNDQPFTLSDIPPAGYPQEQQRHSQPPPLQGYVEPSYGQPPYVQQPYYQQAYAQPPSSQQAAESSVYAAHAPPYADIHGNHNKRPYQPAFLTGSPYDEETGRIDNALAFLDKAVRLAFVRKVFGILSLMMALTVSVVCTFMFVDPVRNYLKAPNTWPFWAAFALSFGLLIYLSCSSSGARKYPSNMICLIGFTLCQSVLVGTVTIYAEPKAVLLAAGLTLGITLSLTLFAVQTKFDFTTWGGALIGVLLVLITCTLVGFFVRIKWYHLVISGVGALLFCVFLVYDVQLVMGKGKYALGPDEYVFGALALYLDIINIFLYILAILGLVNND